MGKIEFSVKNLLISQKTTQPIVKKNSTAFGSNSNSTYNTKFTAYPINAERNVQHLLSERRSLSDSKC